MNEKYYEELLNIDTCKEQEGFNDSIHYNRYEATSYLALESLFKQYTLNSSDYIVDFGCGKGRLAFYINYYYNSSVTGIEMNNNYYDICENNKRSYFKAFSKPKEKINFLNIFAEDYKVLPSDNKFYFFNPFSLQLFIKVLNNILISVEQFPREIDLIFYYPSEEYIDYLENYTALTLKQEIPVHNLYLIDKRQKFSIYTLPN